MSDEHTFGTDPDQLFEDLRLSSRAAKGGYPIPDSLREVAVRVCVETLGDSSASTRDRDRAVRTVVTMDRMNVDRERTERVDANIEIPITPEELRAMSDEELAAFRRNLDRLAGKV